MNGKQLFTSTVSTIIKVVVLAVIVMVVYRWAVKAYDFGYRVFTEGAVSDEPGISYTITLSEDTTPKELSKALEQYGLVEDANLFYVQYLLSDYRDELVPGTYQLSTAMDADEMLEVMSQEDDDSETEEADETTSSSTSEIETETEATGTQEAGE